MREHDAEETVAPEVEQLQRALAWEQHMVRHWRALAKDRSRELRRLRRHRTVRLALAMERFVSSNAEPRRASLAALSAHVGERVRAAAGRRVAASAGGTLP